MKIDEKILYENYIHIILYKITQRFVNKLHEETKIKAEQEILRNYKIAGEFSVTCVLYKWRVI